jgi:hypothetical protein
VVSAGGYDAFLVKLDSDGNLVWRKQFGDDTYQYGDGVATDASDNVIVTGRYSGTIDFGKGPLTSAGDYDVFIAKYDASGGAVWSMGFGDAGLQTGTAVAADAQGNVFVTGLFDGTLPMPPLTPLTGAGNTDVFVAKLKNTDGAPLWAKAFGDTSEQRGEAIAVDKDGNVLVTGSYRGVTTFGGMNLPDAGSNTNVFAAKLQGSDGEHIWSNGYGDPMGGQTGAGIAVNMSGDIVLTGSFDGVIDFGGGSLTSAGGLDVFVTKLTK